MSTVSFRVQLDPYRCRGLMNLFGLYRKWNQQPGFFISSAQRKKLQRKVIIDYPRFAVSYFIDESIMDLLPRRVICWSTSTALPRSITRSLTRSQWNIYICIYKYIYIGNSLLYRRIQQLSKDCEIFNSAPQRNISGGAMSRRIGVCVCVCVNFPVKCWRILQVDIQVGILISGPILFALIPTSPTLRSPNTIGVCYLEDWDLMDRNEPVRARAERFIHCAPVCVLVTTGSRSRFRKTFKWLCTFLSRGMTVIRSSLIQFQLKWSNLSTDLYTISRFVYV
jgi:hypothetical protein